MNTGQVIFLSYKASENHGIAYMRSVLAVAGYRSFLLDIRQGKNQILREIKKRNPLLIGFSIIYHDNILDFTRLINFLRESGLMCHFTAGGHYSSLRYQELFNSLTFLDSVIRFEGEYPVLELVRNLEAGKNWRNIPGLVYKHNGRLIVNPTGAVETNLDNLPFPYRPRLKRTVFGLKSAAILSGRGCTYNCSFCNTKEYYRQMGGPYRRNRLPSMIVKEMLYLFYHRKCMIYMFDDDNFPVNSFGKNEWAIEFCNEIASSAMAEKITWKINCRPDAVSEDLFRLLRKNGLSHVFIGIEDGTDTGLKRINKRTTTSEILKSIRILKKLKIGFDYGFMLFQPETTFISLRENLKFLKTICGDGYTPLTFLKLIPLYETKVERDLKKKGSLKIINGRNDYEYDEPGLNDYCNFVFTCLFEWLTSPAGFVNIAQWGGTCFEVNRVLGKETYQTSLLHEYFRKIISDSNRFILSILNEMSNHFQSGHYLTDLSKTEDFRKNIQSKHKLYKLMISSVADEFVKSAILGRRS